MRISACRGKQIALLNIKYTPKIGRGNYLTYLFKSILINKGWKRHLPVCFLNCVSIAIWNLIHSHIIPHTGASTSNDSALSGHFWTRLQFSLGTHTVVFFLWQQCHLCHTYSIRRTDLFQQVDTPSQSFVSPVYSHRHETQISVPSLWEEISRSIDWIGIVLEWSMNYDSLSLFRLLLGLVLISSPRSLFGFCTFPILGPTANQVNTQVWIWEIHQLSCQISYTSKLQYIFLQSVTVKWSAICHYFSSRCVTL